MIFFFFNDTATTEIYTLSLHDALPICGTHAGGYQTQWGRRRGAHARGALRGRPRRPKACALLPWPRGDGRRAGTTDRKSTRLNSSHANISYAVFCLKKKKITWISLVSS